jgi:hypothetical protein
MIREAEFSECGKYRYVLSRIWDETKPMAMCIGLNPSTANGVKDDHTIRLLIKYIGQLGFGGFYMCNVYALISSKPEVLTSSPDPVANNAHWLNVTAFKSQTIIFCWGSFSQAEWRGKQLAKLFPDAKCFGKTANGSPWHPRHMGYIKDYVPSLRRYNKAVPTVIESV